MLTFLAGCGVGLYAIGMLIHFLLMAGTGGLGWRGLVIVLLWPVFLGILTIKYLVKSRSE